MEKKQCIRLLVLLLTVSTSCDSNLKGLATDFSNYKIEFAPVAFVDENMENHSLSRGEQIEQATIKDFGVYAYYVTDRLDITTAVPNFMCNTKVEKTSGGWHYQPQMYWPNSGTVSFYAYSPYVDGSDSSLTLSSTPQTLGAPRLMYKIPDDIQVQQDLLISAPLFDQTKINRTLVLPFKHTLSSIIFEAKMLSRVDFPVKVAALTIGNLKDKATCQYKKESDRSVATWEITDDAENKTYSLSLEGGLENFDISSRSDYCVISANNHVLMPFPQMIDEDDFVTVTINLYVNGRSKEPTVKTTTVKLRSLINELGAGKRYAIRIGVTALADMTLNCSVEPWKIETIAIPDFD